MDESQKDLIPSCFNVHEFGHIDGYCGLAAAFFSKFANDDKLPDQISIKEMIEEISKSAHIKNEA